MTGKLILPNGVAEQRKLEKKSFLGATIGIDGKTLMLKAKPLSHWQAWLEKVTAVENPDNLSPAEMYIHQSFRDLVNLIIEHQGEICKLLRTSTQSGSSTSSSGSHTKVPPESSQPS